MQCVIETEAYLSSAKATGLTEEERERITLFIASNPTAGDLIPGTGGARKLRFPLRNKGKSGGVRVVTYYAGEDIPVFLLDVFAKGDKINLSQAERNTFREILKEMAEEYRQTATKKIAELKERVG